MVDMGDAAHGVSETLPVVEATPENFDTGIEQMPDIARGAR